MQDTKIKPNDKRVLRADLTQSGYFTGWVGDTQYITSGSTTGDTIYITMPSSSITLTANFNPYRTLTVNYGKILSAVNYGYLYNSSFANNANAAPVGWHVGRLEDFTTLISNVGANNANKLKLNSSQFWSDIPLNATNELGFNAKGSGWRQAYPSTIYRDELSSLYMNMKFSNGVYGYCRIQGINISMASDSGLSMSCVGASIRLMKDSTTLTHGQTSFVTDYDGNVYPTICIYGQEWTAENFRCTHYNNGTSIPLVPDPSIWYSSAYYFTGARCAYNNNELKV